MQVDGEGGGGAVERNIKDPATLPAKQLGQFRAEQADKKRVRYLRPPFRAGAGAGQARSAGGLGFGLQKPKSGRRRGQHSFQDKQQAAAAAHSKPEQLKGRLSTRKPCTGSRSNRSSPRPVCLRKLLRVAAFWGQIPTRLHRAGKFLEVKKNRQHRSASRVTYAGATLRFGTLADPLI